MHFRHSEGAERPKNPIPKDFRFVKASEGLRLRMTVKAQKVQNFRICYTLRTMNILEVKNLTLKKNGKRIIDNLSFTLRRGQVHAVVGPNGAGKSTLAYILMGLEGYRDFIGEIVFDGSSLKGFSVTERARRGITLAWQEPARFEGLTVDSYLGASSLTNGKRVPFEEALARVGLCPREYLTRVVDDTLSGGERKRIELASIIAMQPQLVILDEPDSGIDIESLQNIFETVKYLKSKGTTVVLITHSLAILKQADTALLLCDGKLRDSGSVDKIYNYFKGRCAVCEHQNEPEEVSL